MNYHSTVMATGTEAAPGCCRDRSFPYSSMSSRW